jgi:hypothetical protein
MVDLSYKLQKAIMNNAFSKEEYEFIASIINAERDIEAPLKAIEAYAMDSLKQGPISPNHTLDRHVKLSISIYDKLKNVTLTEEDIRNME